MKTNKIKAKIKLGNLEVENVVSFSIHLRLIPIANNNNPK